MPKLQDRLRGLVKRLRAPVKPAPTTLHSPPERGTPDPELSDFNVGESVVVAGHDQSSAPAMGDERRQSLVGPVVVADQTPGTVKAVGVDTLFVEFAVDVPIGPWRKAGDDLEFRPGDRVHSVGVVQAIDQNVALHNRTPARVLQTTDQQLTVAVLFQFPRSPDKADWRRPGADPLSGRWGCVMLEVTRPGRNFVQRKARNRRKKRRRIYIENWYRKPNDGVAVNARISTPGMELIRLRPGSRVLSMQRDLLRKFVLATDSDTQAMIDAVQVSPDVDIKNLKELNAGDYDAIQIDDRLIILDQAAVLIQEDVRDRRWLTAQVTADSLTVRLSTGHEYEVATPEEAVQLLESLYGTPIDVLQEQGYFEVQYKSQDESDVPTPVQLPSEPYQYVVFARDGSQWSLVGKFASADEAVAAISAAEGEEPHEWTEYMSNRYKMWTATGRKISLRGLLEAAEPVRPELTSVESKWGDVLEALRQQPYAINTPEQHALATAVSLFTNGNVATVRDPDAYELKLASPVDGVQVGKMHSYDIQEPSQAHYELASRVMASLAEAPNPKPPETIFRGMVLPRSELPELEPGGLFDMRNVASWSTDYDTAVNFAVEAASGANFGSSAYPVLFQIASPERGTYLGTFSHYPAEDEYVIGGMVRITKTFEEGGDDTTPEHLVVYVEPLAEGTRQGAAISERLQAWIDEQLNQPQRLRSKRTAQVELMPGRKRD